MALKRPPETYLKACKLPEIALLDCGVYILYRKGYIYYQI